MTEVEQISYRDGQTALTGLLVRPAHPARAALVLYPTIANHNEAMKRRAAMFAQAGFLVMVADFYGSNPVDFPQAHQWGAALRDDTPAYRARCTAALEALRSRPETEGLPMVAVGYCMGGQAALEMAREGHDLAGVVTYHGLLATGRPAQPDTISARILVCHGDADPMVPREQVMAFWEEMDHAGADWHFHSYSGVRHGFTDPASDARGLPAIGYDAAADASSWAATHQFLDTLLG
ncbi:dienelactone hydrolase family protein [Novosphingobium colocasiae]|uniref:Dienelactone hydrolase n=1 Tax=Novosphingobium colocasiae TaxID=1256513 RepID=A0A918PC66_9SPHN|nr:dienelactone hydrolase family protein [Novosphingobium colocasiae]GGY97600.1 dienelactone hydrolase [Novosphingobium colocasiae]